MLAPFPNPTLARSNFVSDYWKFPWCPPRISLYSISKTCVNWAMVKHFLNRLASSSSTLWLVGIQSGPTGHPTNSCYQGPSCLGQRAVSLHEVCPSWDGHPKSQCPFQNCRKKVQKDSSAWWHIKQADLHAKCSSVAMQGVCSLPVVAEK